MFWVSKQHLPSKIRGEPLCQFFSPSPFDRRQWIRFGRRVGLDVRPHPSAYGSPDPRRGVSWIIFCTQWILCRFCGSFFFNLLLRAAFGWPHFFVLIDKFSPSGIHIPEMMLGVTRLHCVQWHDLGPTCDAASWIRCESNPRARDVLLGAPLRRNKLRPRPRATSRRHPSRLYVWCFGFLGGFG